MTEMTEPSSCMTPFPCEFGMSGKSIAMVQKYSYSGNRLALRPINLLASSQDMNASKMIGSLIRIT
jgi:hypothetical protein